MNFNEKLIELQNQISTKRTFDTRFATLKKQREVLESQIFSLKNELDKENADVENLDKKNIKNVFLSLTNKMNDKRDKEESEANTAKVNYENAVQKLADVNSQMSQLNAQRIEFINCENEYIRTLREKETYIIESDSDFKEKLLEIDEKIKVSKNFVKEVDEALNVAKKIDVLLDSALSELKSAENWGTYDVLGGGMISDIAKHDHINSAQNQIERIKEYSNSLNKELADLKMFMNVDVGIYGFDKFADFMLDGIFFDWSVLSKIKNSIEELRSVSNKFAGLISKLNNMKNTAEKELYSYTNQREQMIYNY